MVYFTKDELHDLAVDAYDRCDDPDCPKCQKMVKEILTGFIHLGTIKDLDPKLVEDAIAKKRGDELARYGLDSM